MIKSIMRTLAILFCILLFWQSIVFFLNTPDYILPSPWAVFLTLYLEWHLITSNMLSTLVETLLGFAFGILFGCLTGLAVAFFRPLALWFLPLLIVSQAIPTFAIAPLLVIWLGFGLASKVATSVLMIFFPVASAFYDGLQRTPCGWLDLAKTMNASKLRIFLHLRIPASLPTLASGIRVAAVFAPIGAIIGEWVGASKGIGYLMLNANARLQIDLMFAALLVIIAFALLLYFSVDHLLKKLIWWPT